MHRAPDAPAVLALTEAIAAGDLDALGRILDADPELAVARIGDDTMSRCVLHVATDFPGHRPNTAAVIALLVERGADVNARFAGPHRETPLHWAASNDDVEAVDALVAAGADLEADGAVLTGGSPLDDAVVFDGRAAARRLYELGAETKLFHAAALGVPDRVEELLAPQPDPDTVTGALWHACRVGSASAAAVLLRAGGDPDWVGWDDLTPRAAAEQGGHVDVVAVLDGLA